MPFAAIAGAALLAAGMVGALLAWIITRRVARARLARERSAWNRRLGARAAAVGRRAGQAADDLESIQSRLRSAEAALAAATGKNDRQAAELADTRAAVARLTREVDEHVAAARDLALDRERLASAAAAEDARAERLERELDAAVQEARREREAHQQALVAADRTIELVRRDVSAAEHQAAQVQARLGRERDQAVAAAAEALAAAQAAGVRRRDLELALEASASEHQAALGALRARAERVEPLLRQVEDRDALLRAVMFERDEARRMLVALERDAAVRLAGTEAALVRTKQTLADSDRTGHDVADLVRRLAAVGKERDAADAESRRLALELATVRAELKERDRRFRLLAAENGSAVDGFERRIRELEDVRPSNGSGLAELPAGGNGHEADQEPFDDLTAIRGIGPVIAARLEREGVARFDEIARWTEGDIDRFADVLKLPAARIRRENWVGSASALLQSRADARA